MAWSWGQVEVFQYKKSFMCLLHVTVTVHSQSHLPSSSSPIFRTLFTVWPKPQTRTNSLRGDCVIVIAAITQTHSPSIPPILFHSLIHLLHSSHFSSSPCLLLSIWLLSRGLVSGSASQASPLLIILHHPWSKSRTGIHLIRTPTSPPQTNSPCPNCRVAQRRKRWQW